jgi:hypothetical protein
MVIHFGLKQFLFQIFLVASFNLVTIPDILCYLPLCLRTPIPHCSVCPLDFALSTGRTLTSTCDRTSHHPCNFNVLEAHINSQFHMHARLFGFSFAV